MSEWLQRLLARAEARLHAGQRTVRLALVAGGLVVIAALGAAAWPILVELHSERVATGDPRPAYASRVKDRIQKTTRATFENLPRQDRSGTLKLRIEINPDGQLIAATVAEPSGFSDIDGLALRIVKEAAPFEPFPADMRRTTTSVEIVSEFVFQ
jgi:TonB family protein